MTIQANHWAPPHPHAYTAAMSAQPDFPPADHLPAKNLRAIRAALTVPQDTEAFDTGLSDVLAEVRRDLNLAALDTFVHRWWLIACDSATDPGGRADMYQRAERANQLAAQGVPLPRGGKTVAQLLAERGIHVEP